MLDQILEKVNEYIGGLIDITEMPQADKDALKAHLLAAEEILTRNGVTELREFISGVTAAVLSRF